VTAVHSSVRRSAARKPCGQARRWFGSRLAVRQKVPVRTTGSASLAAPVDRSALRQAEPSPGPCRHPSDSPTHPRARAFGENPSTIGQGLPCLDGLARPSRSPESKGLARPAPEETRDCEVALPRPPAAVNLNASSRWSARICLSIASDVLPHGSQMIAGGDP